MLIPKACTCSNYQPYFSITPLPIVQFHNHFPIVNLYHGNSTHSLIGATLKICAYTCRNFFLILLTHRILSLQLCEESKSTNQQGLTEGPKDWVELGTRLWPSSANSLGNHFMCTRKIGCHLLGCGVFHSCTRVYFLNLIAKTVAVYKYAYRSVILFCNTTGS